MRRLSPHAVVGYSHRLMRRRAVEGDAMVAGLGRRRDHRPGRDARRPPAGPDRPTLHGAALRPRRGKAAAQGSDEDITAMTDGPGPQWGVSRLQPKDRTRTSPPCWDIRFP